ncbi:MAG: DUF1801 domain-containing protein [Prolixibacteraceae bacterium]
MNKEIEIYNDSQVASNKKICICLAELISQRFPNAEHKIWHSNPVWFLEGNPIVGYSKLKNCIQLLFWSGQSFDEILLHKKGKFKAAEICYTSLEQIDKGALSRWLKKSEIIQWDYKNIVERKGKLERLM